MIKDIDDFFVTYEKKDYTFRTWNLFLCEELDHLPMNEQYQKLEEITKKIPKKFTDKWYLEKWGLEVDIDVEVASKIKEKIQKKSKKLYENNKKFLEELGII